MEAYYNLLYYSQLTSVYEEQVKTAEVSLKKARRQEELGQKGYADVIEMESNLADKQYNHITMLNKAADARLPLEDVMFWSNPYELTIDTDVPENFTDAIRMEAPVGMDEMVDYAQKHQPASVIARYNLMNAKSELKTARWQLLPTLSAYGGWSTTYYSYPGGAKTDPFKKQFKNPVNGPQLSSKDMAEHL